MTPPSPSPPDDALLTDLYQLTMMQAYLEQGMTAPAVFELAVRRLPPRRNFLIAAGLDQALAYLERLRFRDPELDWLRVSGRFSRDFVDHLAGLRFTGDVDAMPEGTVAFGGEPLVRVTAPLPEAQLVETRILNLVHLETVIASKAVRCVLAAPGKVLVEFGLRRAHGAEAGMLAARAAYLAGFAGTSNVLAAVRWGLPVYGTMAHSFVEAHDDEAEAFAAFARSHPGRAVLLLDTYDTEEAARTVVRLAPALAESGVTIQGVRLNSGDFEHHARAVRAILDEGGLSQLQILASGALDERKLARLTARGAPIDGYGIGTRLVTSADAPSLDAAYKLVEYAGRPRFKLSEGKATWPGPKQVHRLLDRSGRMVLDEIALADEQGARGIPLLEPAMKAGRRLAEVPLEDSRRRAAAQLAALPPAARSLRRAWTYPVHLSAGLRELALHAAGQASTSTLNPP